MSRMMITTVGLVMALAGAGCFRTPGGPGIDGRYVSPTEDWGRGSSALMVANGQQSGDMGDIRGFSAPARDLSGTYSPTYTSVRLDSVGSGWWVMSALHISGDLAGPAFAPGTRRTFTTGVWEEGQPSVSVTGCSGPEYGNYTFDASESDVEISVQALPNGMRRMTYTVTFDDGATTQGSFDYRIEGGSTGTVRSGI